MFPEFPVFPEIPEFPEFPEPVLPLFPVLPVYPVVPESAHCPEVFVPGAERNDRRVDTGIARPAPWGSGHHFFRSCLSK